jgi:hypothetical protein
MTIRIQDAIASGHLHTWHREQQDLHHETDCPHCAITELVNAARAVHHNLTDADLYDETAQQRLRDALARFDFGD